MSFTLLIVVKMTEAPLILSLLETGIKQHSYYDSSIHKYNTVGNDKLPLAFDTLKEIFETKYNNHDKIKVRNCCSYCDR